MYNKHIQNTPLNDTLLGRPNLLENSLSSEKGVNSCEYNYRVISSPFTKRVFYDIV